MKKLLLSTFVFMAGCVSNEIDQIGPDTYIITRDSMAFTGRDSKARSNAIRAATQFCLADSRIFQVVSIQMSPEPLFGPPQTTATIQFMCLKPGDPDLRHPKLQREADTVIEVR